MRRRIGLQGLPGTAAAAVGVIVGHWAAYVISVPRAPARTAVLAASGHGYWQSAIKVAVVLAFVVVGSTFVRHLSLRPAGERSEPEGGLALWGRLSFLQVLGFTAMEITERLMAHAPLASMFHHDLFAVGLAVQVVVALAAALVLRWLSGRVKRFVAAHLRALRHQPQALVGRPSPAVFIPRPRLAGAAGLRGPPAIVRI